MHSHTSSQTQLRGKEGFTATNRRANDLVNDNHRGQGKGMDGGQQKKNDAAAEKNCMFGHGKRKEKVYTQNVWKWVRSAQRNRDRLADEQYMRGKRDGNKGGTG